MELDANSKEAQKWEGLVSADLPSAIKPDQAWSLLADFCSLHKFFPSIGLCCKSEGPENEPGCVRYCAGLPDPAGSVNWVKEKLVEINPVERCYSYVITESNMGFGSYHATLRVVEGGSGCRVEWSFEAEPVQGWTRSGFVEYLEGGVKEMAKRIGEVLCGGNCGCADVNGVNGG